MKIEETTIGVTTVAFSKNKQLVDQLNTYGFKSVKTNTAGERFNREGLISYLSDCDAAIIGLDKVDAELLQMLPKLKIISKYGVGLDNIDIKACEIAGVKVLHTQGVNRRSVSEMALGFMLALCRNLYITSNRLKSGFWNKDGGYQLTGKTIGIIGVGNIGKDLIELLRPFNCKILVNDIIDQKEYYDENGLFEVSKEELFKKSDVITIHTPLTTETRFMINERSLKLMKSSAIVLNTARGGIVNQNDIKEALLNRSIGGAAMDAYEIEPPEDKELLDIPNFMNTPHIGGNAKEAVIAMGESAINNLVNHYSAS